MFEASSSFRRRPRIESLEKRQLLAAELLSRIETARGEIRFQDQGQQVTGVTVLTHGYARANTTDGNYLLDVGQSILNRSGGQLIQYRVDDASEPGTITVHDPIFGTDGDNQRELVFLFDWEQDSGHASNGWAPAAAESMFAIMVGLGLVDPETPQQDFQYHFIGHSFGTAVTSEVVERFGQYSIVVDHVTYLDPHDFDEAPIPVDTDQDLWTLAEPSDPSRTSGNSYGVANWDNVAFTDVYYQTRSELQINDEIELAAQLAACGIGAAFASPTGPGALAGCKKGFDLAGDVLELSQAAASQLVPSGRPIPGAFNVHLQTELDKVENDNLPYWHDHTSVWSSYYLDSVRDPDINPHGYRYARTSGHADASSRPTPSSIAGGFYSPEQVHDHSSDLLIASKLLNTPNTQWLDANGYTLETFNTVSWTPSTDRYEIANGDFDLGLGSGVFGRVSPYKEPGWSFHGGQGNVLVSSGQAFLRLLSLNGEDLSSINHNLLYIPPGTGSLQFDLARKGAQFPFAPSIASGNYRLRVSVGSHNTYFNVADLATEFPSAKYAVAVPEDVRGTVNTIGFYLEGPTDNGTPSEGVAIDNIEFSVLPTDVLKPDLVPLDITTVTPNVNFGQNVLAQATITNAGSLLSGPFQYRYVLSLDDVFDSNDPVLGNPINHGGILAGQTDVTSDVLPLFLNVTHGSVYRLGVIVDPVGSPTPVDEAIESNNTLISETRVGIDVDPPSLIDIELSSIDGPETATPGSQIQVQTVVTNPGETLISDFSVGYFLRSGNTTIPLSNDPIPRDSFSPWTQALTIPSDVPAGEYALAATVSLADGLVESSLFNNYAQDLTPVRIVEPVAPGSERFGFVYPIGNPSSGAVVTQQFGQGFGSRRGHLGTDFRGSVGDPVRAVADGFVTRSTNNAGTGWGPTVIIQHATKTWGLDEDYASMYAHVVPAVTDGQRVLRGDVIGHIAPTQAGSTAPHLHFELRSGSDADYEVGLGYRGFDFDRFTAPAVSDPSGQKDLTWHDFIQVIDDSGSSQPPVTDRVDFRPLYVNAPASGAPGQSVSVYTEIQNAGSTASDDYEIRYVISQDKYVTLRDETLIPIVRDGLPAGKIDRFSTTIMLPNDLDIGEDYWIGVLVDPGRQINELYDSNNDLAARAPLTVSATQTGIPVDLYSTSLELSTPLRNYVAGQRVSVDYTIANAGSTSSTPAQATFYLSDHPTHPTESVQVAVDPIPAITAQSSGKGNVRFLIPPGSFEDSLSSVYLTMSIAGGGDTNLANNQNRGNGLTSTLLRSSEVAGQSDLTGSSFEISPIRRSYHWGETIDIVYSFENIGVSRSLEFGYEFYLSNNPGFSPTEDYWVASRRSRDLLPGEDGTIRVHYRLPSEPPAGFESGPLYLGAILNPDRDVPEATYSNNRGMGAGIDFAAITVVPAPPTSNVPEPVIGNFTATPAPPESVLRGEKVYLTASNVLDDNNNVNDVSFRIDSNNNGQWDESDYFIGHGSRVGITATLETRTNANWPTGDVPLMVRATDGHGLHSDISFTTVNVIGNATGAFPDDDFENNDTLETAHFLGGGSSYHLENLAILPGDADYFSFDINGDAQQIQATINFTQEDFQGNNVPTGDLTLQLAWIPPGGGIDYQEISFFSQPGETSEQVTRAATSPGASVGGGRFIIIVSGAQAYEQNSNYTLDISITQHANSPVAGPLTTIPESLVQGRDVRLSMEGITNINAQGLDAVHFYADFNRDGNIQAGTEYLGTDWTGPPNNTGEGPNGEFIVDVDTSDWPLGETRVLAIVRPKFGFASLAEYSTVTVLPNHPPTIGSLAGPTTVIQGGDVTLTATNVSDSDPAASVSGVEFFIDTNENQIYDGSDNKIGDGILSDDDWSLTVNTLEWNLGQTMVFAVARDELELASDPSPLSLTILESDNVKPDIASFITADSVIKGDPLLLLASGVTDPNNDPLLVEFLWDSNQNNTLDDADTLIGLGTQNGNDWSLSVDTSTFVNGPTLFFVRASDNGIPAYATDSSSLVNIVDTTGPKIVSQTPAESVFGSIDQVIVEFDEPIDPETFTLDDIEAASTPSGALTIDDITAVPGSNDTQFRLSFARQTTFGNYSITIAPTLLDLGGNELDQDADGTPGETSDDAYTLSFGVAAPDLALEWVTHLSNSGFVRVEDLVVDSADNVIVVGGYSGTVDFERGTAVSNMTSAGGIDAFVAKYDVDGNLLWVRSAGGVSSDKAETVSLDQSGNIYLAGVYRETADFDSGPGTIPLTTAPGNGGAEDTFIWKLDSNGNHFWVKTIGGPKRDTPHSIAVHGTNIYLTGEFSNTADFDPNGGVFNLTSTPNSNTSISAEDAYLMRMTTSGNFVWARAMGSSQVDVGLDLAVDSSGSIYTVGKYAAAADFDKTSSFGNVTFSGSVAAFVTKHASTGLLFWVKTIQSHTVNAHGIAIDANDNLYITGDHFSLQSSRTGDGDFDPGPGTAIVTTQGHDGFVTKWTSSGAFNWVHSFENANSLETLTDVAIGDDGDIYVAGQLANSSLAKLDPLGNVEWTKDFPGNTIPSAIAVTNQDRVNLGGWFRGTVDFDPDSGTVSATSAGSDDGFVVQLRKPIIVNLPPVLSLENTVSSLAEDLDVGTRTFIADLTVTDDGLGTNTLALTGSDAGLFEIVDSSLYLRSGVSLDHELTPELSVTVSIDDETILPSPNDSQSVTIAIDDVNEPPTLLLENTLTSLSETADVSSPLRITDLTILDDAIGSNTMTLSGNDAHLFSIVDSSLVIQAGAALDFESNPVLDVTIELDDPSLGSGVEDSQSISLSLIDVDDESPEFVNASKTVTRGTFTTVTASELSASDIDSNDATIVFELHSIPTSGILRLNNTPLMVGDTFTQQDIINGNVDLLDLGGQPGQDSFSVTARDPQGNASAPQAVTLSLIPAPQVTNQRTNTTFATLSDGIANALSGDTLVIGEGTYPETIVVDKAISLVAAKPGKVIIDGQGTTGAIIQVSADASFTGLTVRNGATGFTTASDITYQCDRCIVSDVDAGFAINGSSGRIGRAIITHSIIFNTTTATNINDGDTIEISNSIIDASLIAYRIHNGNSIISRNNLLHGVTARVAFGPIMGSVPNDPGEVLADPQFVDQAQGNYQLSIGSPAIDAGFDLGQPYDGLGPDIGAFEHLVPDVTEVAINGGGQTRSLVTSLNVQFDDLIDHASLSNAFSVLNIQNNETVGTINVEAQDIENQTMVLLTFAGNSTIARGGTGQQANSLADGNYQLNIDASKITSRSNSSVMATDYLFGGQNASDPDNDNFFRLFGDTDGDGDVDARDLSRLGPTYLKSVGSEDFDPNYDSDGDGDVDARDYSRFQMRFLTSRV